MTATAIDQVICPIDLSPASASALRYAAAWARAYDAPLRVLYAVQTPQIIADATGQTLVFPSCSVADVRTAGGPASTACCSGP